MLLGIYCNGCASNLLNLLNTERTSEPYLIGWQKMGDFFEVFPSKPNLEPTEPQKTEQTSELNQVRPNTIQIHSSLFCLQL